MPTISNQIADRVLDRTGPFEVTIPRSAVSELVLQDPGMEQSLFTLPKHIDEFPISGLLFAVSTDWPTGLMACFSLGLQHDARLARVVLELGAAFARGPLAREATPDEAISKVLATCHQILDEQKVDRRDPTLLALREQSPAIHLFRLGLLLGEEHPEACRHLRMLAIRSAPAEGPTDETYRWQRELAIKTVGAIEPGIDHAAASP